MKSKKMFSLIFLLWSFKAFAIDMIEPYNPGFSDVEAYFDSGKIGSNNEPEFVSLELVIGGGVTDKISVFASGVIPVDTQFREYSKALSLGAIWNFLDAGLFNADFQIGGGLSGTDLNTPFLAPMLELNLSLKAFGVFLQNLLNISEEESSAGSDKIECIYSSFIAAGAYVHTHTEGQLFLQWLFLAPIDENEVSSRPESISLGYNLIVSSFAELITEARMHIAHESDESFRLSFLTGIIITLQ